MALLVWIVIGLLVAFVGAYVTRWDLRDIRLYVYAAAAAVFGGLLAGVLVGLLFPPQGVGESLMNVLTDPFYAIRGALRWAIIGTGAYLIGIRRGWWR